MTTEPSSAALRDAIAYWERRRIVYNLVLVAFALGWGVLTWPHFLGAFTPRHLVALGVLALVANACYCAAYLIDIPMQSEASQAQWRRRRWMLFWTGMLLAIVLENYWIAGVIGTHVG